MECRERKIDHLLIETSSIENTRKSLQDTNNNNNNNNNTIFISSGITFIIIVLLGLGITYYIIRRNRKFRNFTRQLSKQISLNNC